jgi:hypothetical protein
MKTQKQSIKAFLVYILILVVISLVLLATESNAQVQSIDTGFNLRKGPQGYEGLTYGSTTTIVLGDKNIKILSNLSLLNAKKEQTGDGFLVSFGVDGRYYIKDIFIGGGINLAKIWTNAYEKAAFSPTIHGGYNYRDMVISQVKYYFRDNSHNRNRTIEFRVDMYWFNKEVDRWYLKLSPYVGLSRFQVFEEGDFRGKDFGMVISVGKRF